MRLESYCSEMEMAASFENKILYKMCCDYPGHDDAQVTSGKVLAIGRIYAASPERGAGERRSGGISLTEQIGKELKKRDFDAYLLKIGIEASIREKEVLHLVIEAHGFLVEAVVAATLDWSTKRSEADWKPRKHVSFASKYLHFHRPNAFPIMDSFAKAGLNCAGQKGIFSDYSQFCSAFLAFANERDSRWTPRSIDTELVKRGRAHKGTKKGDFCEFCALK